MTEAASLVGQVVLGEHRLDSLVREEDGLATFAATSTVDGGRYTVLVAIGVAVETSSMALETAVERAARHAVGIRSLVPVLHARTVPVGDASRLGVVRRGEPGGSVTELLGSPRSVRDVVKLLSPVAAALHALHDQGIVHGAVSPATLTTRGDDLVLDFFGLSAAAEAANGSRGARDALPSAFRAPEVGGDLPTSPGPWSDTWALARIAVALLVGGEKTAEAGALPTPRGVGAEVADRVEEAFARALAPQPSSRPDPAALLELLAVAADDPIRAPEAKPIEGPPAPIAPVVAAPRVRPLANVAPRESIAEREARDPASKLLGWAIALGLAMLAIGTTAAIAYVIVARGAPTGPTPVPPPSPTWMPVSPTPPPVATEPPIAPITPPRASGPATYPDDHDALVPVDADSLVRGDRDALLTLVIFGELTCPFTAREIAAIPALEARYGGDLRIVFEHYPLPSDADAERAAEAVVVAGTRGGSAAAWKFVELAAADHDHLDPGRLEELGIKAGLPAGAITDGVAKHAGKAAVDRDVELGRRLGIHGTPVMLINGRRLDGYQTAQTLAVFLDGELRRARAAIARGVPRAKLYETRVYANVTTSEGEAPPQ